MFNKVFPKVHNEGYRFLIFAAIITFILFFLSSFLGTLGLLITIWVYYFFRDPERKSINDDNYLVSPADGTITQITEIAGPKEFGLENKTFQRISIFMDVFNCHVNRIPCSGTISDISYKPGKFFNASLDKSSDENERNLIKLKTAKNGEIIVVQIAGLIARRIVCECAQNQIMEQGERLGMIRFGSRVDIYFDKLDVLVKNGQTVIAGETLIAKKI